MCKLSIKTRTSSQRKRCPRVAEKSREFHFRLEAHPESHWVPLWREPSSSIRALGETLYAEPVPTAGPCGATRAVVCGASPTPQTAACCSRALRDQRLVQGLQAFSFRHTLQRNITVICNITDLLQRLTFPRETHPRLLGGQEPWGALNSLLISRRPLKHTLTITACLLAWSLRPRNTVTARAVRAVLPAHHHLHAWGTKVHPSCHPLSALSYLTWCSVHEWSVAMDEQLPAPLCSANGEVFVPAMCCPQLPAWKTSIFTLSKPSAGMCLKK